MIQIGRINPIYDLWELKRLISKSETRIITRTCRKSAVSVGFASDADIVDAVSKLTRSDFYKTMQSELNPGTFQDVYKKKINNVNLYIKLQKSHDGKGIVISFKKDIGK